MGSLSLPSSNMLSNKAYRKKIVIKFTNGKTSKWRQMARPYTDWEVLYYALTDLKLELDHCLFYRQQPVVIFIRENADFILNTLRRIERYPHLYLGRQFRPISFDFSQIRQWKKDLTKLTDDLWDVRCEVAHFHTRPLLGKVGRIQRYVEYKAQN
jgi:hypothetical protein